MIDMLPSWLNFDNYNYMTEQSEILFLYYFLSNKLKANKIQNNELVYGYNPTNISFKLSDNAIHNRELALKEMENYIDNLVNRLDVKKINADVRNSLNFQYNIYVSNNSVFYSGYSFYKGETSFLIQMSSTEYDKIILAHNAFCEKVDRSESSPRIFVIVDSMHGLIVLQLTTRTPPP